MPAKQVKFDPQLTVQTVAEQLNVTPRAISNWCRQGRFPGAFKVGNAKTSDWRIPQSSLDTYLKTQRAQAVQA